MIFAPDLCDNCVLCATGCRKQGISTKPEMFLAFDIVLTLSLSILSGSTWSSLEPQLWLIKKILKVCHVGINLFSDTITLKISKIGAFLHGFTAINCQN